MQSNPILNNPYSLPQYHYATNPVDGTLNYNDIRKGRRIFSHDRQAILTKQKQATLLEFNKVATKEELNHIINLLRKEVGDWRNNGYKNTTRVTQTLLNYWFKNPQR